MTACSEKEACILIQNSYILIFLNSRERKARWVTACSEKEACILSKNARHYSVKLGGSTESSSDHPGASHYSVLPPGPLGPAPRIACIGAAGHNARIGESLGAAFPLT